MAILPKECVERWSKVIFDEYVERKLGDGLQELYQAVTLIPGVTEVELRKHSDDEYEVRGVYTGANLPARVFCTRIHPGALTTHGVDCCADGIEKTLRLLPAGMNQGGVKWTTGVHQPEMCMVTLLRLRRPTATMRGRESL